MDYLYFGSMVVTSVLSLSLALFFKTEEDSRLNLAWRLFMLAFVVWSFGRGMMILSQTSERAILWIRVAYCGSIWLAFLWTWMGYEVLKKQINQRLFWASVTVFFFFTITCWTKYFIPDVSQKLSFQFYDDNPGWAFHLWSSIFTIYAVWIHLLLILALKTTTGLVKNRIRWILLAGLLGFGGSASTFPLVNDIPLYPFAVPVVALSPLIMTYAVVKYQLMDLYLLLRDTTVHLISSLALATIFIFIARSINDTNFYVGSMVIMAGTFPLAYPIISRFVRRKINRTRLGDVDRYLEDIEEKSGLLISASLSLRSLSSATIELLSSTFPITDASVYFFRTKAPQSLHLYAQEGFKNELIDILKDSDTFKWLTNNPGTFLLSSIPDTKKSHYGPLIKLFNETKGSLLSSIFSGRQLVGLVILGGKSSLADYHQKDLNALSLISKKIEISCGLATASEKYAVVMGEWSHSLNQITKPIEQSAEVIRDFNHIFPPEKTINMADMILKRVQQLRKFHDYITNTTAITRELITGDFKKETVDIVALVRESVQKYKHENKDIFSIDLPDETVQATVSLTGIDRVLTELISNSLRHTASLGSNAKITISGTKSPTEFIVKVSDNGDGIDPINIEKIWEAGWQQKDMNTGASGLGLSICKQTIEAHGGKVEASSSGKGQGMEISFSVPLNESA